MSSSDATTPRTGKHAPKAPAGPRKPIKGTVTRVLKAAGLTRYVDGGMFGQTTEGFEPTDGRGGIVEVLWRYRFDPRTAVREVMGERNEDRPTLLPQQEGHGQRVKDAKAALEAYGYSVVETHYRGLRGLAVLPAHYAADMEQRAEAAADAEAAALSILPDGEWFTVTADRAIRSDYTQGSGDRAWALALLAELIRALCTPVAAGDRNNDYMHPDSRPVLVMKDCTLFNGVMAPWRTYAFEVTERPADAPTPMAEVEPQERAALEAAEVAYAAAQRAEAVPAAAAPVEGVSGPVAAVEQQEQQVPPLVVRLGPEGEGVWSVSSPVCRGALGAVRFVAGSGGGEGYWRPVGRSAVHDRVPCPAGADRVAAVVALVDYRRARWSDPAVLGEVGAPVRVVEAEYGDDEGARMEAQRRIRGVYPSDSAGERASRAVWLVLRDGGLRMAVQAGLTSGDGQQELWEEGLEVGGHLGWARVVYMAAHPQQKGDGTAYPCWDGSQRPGGGGGLRERRSDALAQARRRLVAAGWQVREVLTDGNGDGAAGALWCLEVWRVRG